MQPSNTEPSKTPNLTEPTHETYIIKPVRSEIDLSTISSLFTSYSTSLKLDLTFQDFTTEMTTLPGKYSPSSNGELLLAHSTSPAQTPLGCVALRSLSFPLPENSTPTSRPTKYCEMKRLYVTPAARGLGVGRALAVEVIRVARSLGYDEMRLDTLPSMVAAQGMYLDLGFVDVEPYCFNPVEGARFLGVKLRKDTS